MKRYIYPFGVISVCILLFVVINNNYLSNLNRHFSVNEKVPEIALKNPKGKNIRLSKLRGKLVLIDFWASWCGPCRRESPNVVEAYHKYHKRKFTNGKGFEVFSVSLDKDKSKWIEAIQKDRLVWKNHCIDEFKKARALYHVKSIPYAILINGDGEVIAQGKELRGIKLHLTLDKYTVD